MKHKQIDLDSIVVDEAMRAITTERDIMCRGAGITAPDILPDDRVRTIRPSHRTRTLRVNPRLYYRSHEALREYLAHGIARLELGPSRIRLYALIAAVVALWAAMLLSDRGTVLAYSAMAAAVLTAVVAAVIAMRHEVRLLREADRITYERAWGPLS